MGNITSINGYGNAAPSPAAPQQAGSGKQVAAQVQAPPQTASQQAPTVQQVQEAVKEMAKAVQPKANSLQFSVDSDSGRTIVRVVDSDTGSVIRQIPSEEVVEIAKDIDRMQSLLLRQKA